MQYFVAHTAVARCWRCAMGCFVVRKALSLGGERLLDKGSKCGQKDKPCRQTECQSYFCPTALLAYQTRSTGVRTRLPSFLSTTRDSQLVLSCPFVLSLFVQLIATWDKGKGPRLPRSPPIPRCYIKSQGREPPNKREQGHD